ncbi:hypothetical protein Cgig2_032197 [Carnegiea gigantea]|uniref:Uncharacterized protein n=1 Tax=Carnegiea gigantea TaxID=171969 RepID=A0A9Q1K374_9CARY|nr:hypothetical protein Cgig2_032197 [Carnegiea gigantea]
MSVMIETIIRQVSEQVKQAMEAANLARPLLHFDYAPTAGCEPSHRQVHILSPHSMEREWEVSRSNWGGRHYSNHHDRHTATAVRLSCRPFRGQMAKSTTASTPYATHSRPTAWLEEQEQTSKPRREALVDRGQIDRFLRRDPHFLRREQEPVQPQPQDEVCSVEVMATIAGGYAEGMTRSAWKAQLGGVQ